MAAALGVMLPPSRTLAQVPKADPWAARLIKAAEAQIGVTLRCDPAYARLAYPGGDVPRERGVCTDVVIRAYRDAFDLDLQRLVHEDMTSGFGNYPKAWGLKRPDRNIDHRRVPNLETFLERKGWSLPVSDNPADWRPGDLFTQRLPAGQPHIGIVCDQMNRHGERPMVIHNIGLGTRSDDILFAFKLAGHFRMPGPA